MKTAEAKGFAGPLRVIAVFIIAAGTLRYAQDFFLPLVLAGLLSFLLSPLVRRLERWHLGRVGAVLATALMAFVLIGGLPIWSPISSSISQGRCQNIATI